MLARQIAIGFGIAVIFPLLVFYGVSTFYPAPKYPSDGTGECMLRAATPEDRVECAEKQHVAREAYTAAAREFSWRLLIVATPLGVAAILIGAYLKFYAIGTGLILGGIFTIGLGYWGYWQYFEDWARLVSLLAGFIILLFVGYGRVATIHSGSHEP
jgi:uncharacterized membrane protein YphA (DoxX/SURF4 family)